MEVASALKGLMITGKDGDAQRRFSVQLTATLMFFASVGSGFSH